MVPATSANLAVGYDVLAMAFNVFNEFELSFSNHTSFEGFDPMYQNKYNLVYQSYLKTLEKTQKESHQLQIVLKSQGIPVSRGLGSSASCVLAGVLAANALHDLGLSNEALFDIAGEIEGHYDNVAAALFGGMQSVLTNGTSRQVFDYTISETFHFGVVIPPFRGSTRQLRAAVPKKIAVQDAIFHIERALLVGRAFETGELSLLKQVLDDRIHQMKRLEVYGMVELFETLTTNDVIVTVSGSGSSLLLISDKAIHVESILPEDYRFIPLELIGGAHCEVMS